MNIELTFRYNVRVSAFGIFGVNAMSHIPVLLKETLEILAPKSGERILDCTFGGGGHTKAILDSCDCYVCAIDRDPEACERASQIKNAYKDRFDFARGNFSQLNNLVAHCEKFNAVLFDFGISSFQVDDAERGFSFQKDAPLDMRMSKEGISACDVINSCSEENLADIIFTYGDERSSRKIASEIVRSRMQEPIKTTVQLANIVRRAISFSQKQKTHSKIDPATKTFQAIRIFVNDELREISEALKHLPEVLHDGARIALISFHYLEDKIVKNWAKSRKNCMFPINRFVVKPTEEEIRQNPRARSAILRGFLYNKSGDDVETRGRN